MAAGLSPPWGARSCAGETQGPSRRKATQPADLLRMGTRRQRSRVGCTEGLTHPHRLRFGEDYLL